MKSIYLLVLIATLIQACSSVKLTPKEQEEIEERQARRFEISKIKY